jgi:two-component SAPR family response regulator
MGEDFFCDYCTVSKMFKEHAHDFFIPENLHLILRGNLLSEMPETWVEDFKYDYEKRLINLLSPQLKNAYEKNDLKNALEIAKLILNIEPFNDEALKYELLAFKKLKGNGHAKKVFEHFTEEYKKSIGTEYPLSFEKLLTEA